MELKNKIRPFLILGLLAWGVSLGYRYDAIWDALGLIFLSYAVYKTEK
tara:strand:- start:591 stop:734 length:144 start_codon:yes stop_codon:yes gene_type:complete